MQLQAGNKDNLNLWKQLCKVSENMFQDVYSRLGVDSRLTICGESFYNDKLPGTIDILRKKGVIEESDGASIMWVEGSQVPLMVQKRDGGYGYDSTDLAALLYRTQKLKADWHLYVIDNSQALHVDNVIGAGRKVGWLKPTDRAEHVGFGVVKGSDGKKFKSRSGDTVRLVDLLDVARDRMEAALKQRKADGACDLTDAEIKHAAEVMGYGGVKYFDLRQHRGTDYEFDYDRMLSPDGDTAVYMQYAHARISSIFRKAEAQSGVKVQDLLKDVDLRIEHPNEMALVCDLLRFYEVLETVIDELVPHKLCDYLYRLSGRFSGFLSHCRVLGSPEMNSRLLLCYATQQVMRAVLTMLGIDALDRI